MRILLVIFILVSNSVGAQNSQIILLHPPEINDYERNKSDYDRLGLKKGAQRTEVCVDYVDDEAKEIVNLTLFEKDTKRFKYTNAVLHIVSIEENGLCFTFAGLKKHDFTSWLKAFISNNSNIKPGSYKIEFR